MKSTDELYLELERAEPILKPKRVCELLGINSTTLALFVRYGLLPKRKIGNKNLLTFEELMDFARMTEGMEIHTSKEGIIEAAALIRHARGRAA